MQHQQYHDINNWRPLSFCTFGPFPSIPLGGL